MVEVSNFFFFEDFGHSPSSSLNPFSVLQQSGPSLSSANSDQVPQRYLEDEDDSDLCRFILVTIH